MWHVVATRGKFNMEIDGTTYMHVVDLHEIIFSNLQPRWQRYENLKLCPTNYTHTEPVLE